MPASTQPSKATTITGWVSVSVDGSQSSSHW